MSYHLDAKSFLDPIVPLNGESAAPFAAESSRQSEPSDRAMDAVLRSVPLPDGLMSRLDKFAHSLGDESADQVDYLGC